ncbi:MAG: helix-turn-helix domain-containing protein [Halobacteriota archaeon]
MLIVEFAVDSPILEETLSRQPNATVRNEAIYENDGEITYLFWVESDDFAAFEAALNVDPTVTAPRVLTEANTRRLYRVTFTSRGDDVATFPAWSELDLVVLNGERTHDGWSVRMRIPDRDALKTYRDICQEQGFCFQLQAVYQDTGEPALPLPEISAPQQEALTKAYQMGYFEIPRGASLAEVAERLELSQQAVSERLRRGAATLVESTFRRELN